MSERKWDNFCWKCHKWNDDDVKCSKCVLTYHENCMQDLNRKKYGWICPRCTDSAKKFSETNVNDNNLSDLLKHCVERVSNKVNCRFVVPDGYKTNKNLIKPITFDDIVSKTKNSEYSSVDDFLFDFEWLRHNCHILQKCGDKDAKNQNAVALKQAKDLFQECVDHVFVLTTCRECYLRKELSVDNFTMVCSVPHLVLWVKYATYPYWPAKLFKLHEGFHQKKPLEVYFFKEYTSARVAYGDCYLYSKEDPNYYCTEQNQSAVRDAVEEADKYIKNLEEKFGTVQLEPRLIKPIVGQLYTKHLYDMIPGFRNANQCMQHAESTFENLKLDDSGYLDPVQEPTKRTDVPVVATKQSIIRVTPAFLEKVKQCRDTIARMKLENQLQRTVNFRLQEEIELMKKEVKHAKLNYWCKNCLTQLQIEVNPPSLCEKCSSLH